MPDLVILGGPNGAGKTTAAQNVLLRELGIREFVNADEIARGLSPFNPEGVAFSAGRLMLNRMQALIRERESFAFETTCAGTTQVRLLQQCKADGWRVILIFLWLPDPEAAVERVARRVHVGGHRIPDNVFVRRYWTGLANMRHLYLPLADVAVIFDNSDGPLILIAEQTPNGAFVVYDEPRWAQLKGQERERNEGTRNSRQSVRRGMEVTRTGVRCEAMFHASGKSPNYGRDIASSGDFEVGIERIENAQK